MRRSRPRKRIISIRQSGGWNKTGASSSVPSYESFKIPTPRGFPSKEVSTPGNYNTMDMSVTGRKRPASDAEHVQESTSSGALLQTEGGGNEGDFACQHSLDEGVGSTRPGVKQIVLRLSGLRQSAATSGESFSVNHSEPVKDMGTETELHRDVWSNATDCSESRQNNNHSMNCSHLDFQSSQHVKPTVRLLHQALQIHEESEPKEEPTETPKEDIPGPPVNGESNSGTLAPVIENQCMLESRDEQARSGLPGHDLPTQNCFPYPANPSWMPNANVCKSCPGTTFPTNSQGVSGCNACAGGTKFTSPDCSFQRGVPRAVRYFVEPASLNEIKCFPRRTEALPACCQRMNFEGSVMYAAQAMKQTSIDLQSRNLVQPPHGHTCGTAHCMSGDDHVLVCPVPWVHKGRLFPGVLAMCMDQQKYEVSWTPPESECQPKSTDASSLREMPNPVFPPTHHTPNFSSDLDMDSQRQLEEQIAHEILLLSQKLANLQARYGARRVVHDNTKPAVLSCPQTPLLLDNPTTQRDGKCSNTSAPSIIEDPNQQRPTTSSSSRSTTHWQLNSRCQVEERKFGGRYIGPNTKGVPSITSSRGSDSGTTIALNKNHPNSRGSFNLGNNTVRTTDAPLVQRWGKVLKETMQATKVSNKSRAFTRKGRELVDVCSYSDDMKENLTRGASVQGYPDGNKRFDWVKTLRFGGVSVHENQGCVDFASQMDSKPSSPREEFTNVNAETWLRDSNEHVVPTSMSKSVQAGRINSPEGRKDACPIEVNDSEMRARRRLDSSIGKPVFKRVESLEEMGVLDSRLAHHLVKAGLRRAPSFWRVPSIKPAPNVNLKLKKKMFGSQSPRKDGGKRLRQKMLFDPNLNAPEVSPIVKVKEHVSQQCEFKGEPIDEATECTMVGNYEAEYETFVENTSDVGQRSNNLDSEEYTSLVNKEALTSQEDAQTKHRSSFSFQEKVRLSEVPIVSLSKQPPHQATKKTFIRCIELVVATKKKNQVLSKLNGHKDSEYNSHRRIVDCSEHPSIGMERDRTHVIEGVACQDDSQVDVEQIIGKPKQSAESLCDMDLIEIQ